MLCNQPQTPAGSGFSAILVDEVRTSQYTLQVTRVMLLGKAASLPDAIDPSFKKWNIGVRAHLLQGFLFVLLFAYVVRVLACRPRIASARSMC